jgi:hypothetical protein
MQKVDQPDPYFGENLFGRRTENLTIVGYFQSAGFTVKVGRKR